MRLQKGACEMYKDGWNQFMKTGQIEDYLAYKGHHPITENKKNWTGKIYECGYAGFCNSNRDCNKGGTNRRI